MEQIRRELLDYSRACEHLLSLQHPLSDDERSLLSYYVRELSQQFLIDPPKPIAYPSVR
jgi:hypothetical protein